MKLLKVIAKGLPLFYQNLEIDFLLMEEFIKKKNMS